MDDQPDWMTGLTTGGFGTPGSAPPTSDPLNNLYNSIIGALSRGRKTPLDAAYGGATAPPVSPASLAPVTPLVMSTPPSPGVAPGTAQAQPMTFSTGPTGADPGMTGAPATAGTGGPLSQSGSSFLNWLGGGAKPPAAAPAPAKEYPSPFTQPPAEQPARAVKTEPIATGYTDVAPRPGGAGRDASMSFPMGGGTPGYHEMVRAAEGTSQNPRSSAYGPGQFIDQTTMDFVRERHPELMPEGKPVNPSLMRQIKSQYGDEMIDWYAEKNAAVLNKHGIQPTDANLYAAHFLGPGGALKLLTADPNANITTIGLSEDALRSNPEVLAPGRTVGQVKQYIANAMTPKTVYPRPPETPAPPAQAAYPKPEWGREEAAMEEGRPRGAITPDFSRARSLYEEGRPKPVNVGDYTSLNLANVLGGLARGAGSVRADQPGSFASALAAAGAGGMQGLGETSKEILGAKDRYEGRREEYALKGAGMEEGMSRAVAEAQQAAQRAITEFAGKRAGMIHGEITGDQAIDQANTLVAHQNAVDMWKNNVTNQQAQYEAQVKEAGLRIPQPHFDANGIAVHRFNPATNSFEVNYHSTKTLLDRATDLANLCKAGPQANQATCDVASFGYVMNAFKDHPEALYPVMQHQAMRDVLRNGQGRVIFGQNYIDAYNHASQRIRADHTLMENKRPEDVEKMIQDEVASTLLNDLATKGETGWIRKAAAFGNIPAIGMMGGMGE